jgi:hypothetical protein
MPLQRILLLDEPIRVQGPPGFVFSTSPRLATATSGATYVLKGPQKEIVVAEAVAYELAEMVGLKVPEFGIADVPGEGVVFASKEVPGGRSSSLELLLGEGVTQNSELLTHCVAFDVWVANDDRNIGNVIVEPSLTPSGAITAILYAIDFEKGQVLRGTNMILVDAIDPRKFWPLEALGRLCRGTACPADFCEAIKAVNQDQIEGVFERVAWEIGGGIPWRESAVYQLVKRGRKIIEMTREVWDGAH